MGRMQLKTIRYVFASFTRRHCDYCFHYFFMSNTIRMTYQFVCYMTWTSSYACMHGNDWRQTTISDKAWQVRLWWPMIHAHKPISKGRRKQCIGKLNCTQSSLHDMTELKLSMRHAGQMCRQSELHLALHSSFSKNSRMSDLQDEFQSAASTKLINNTALLWSADLMFCRKLQKHRVRRPQAPI